jgi:hypothetical protein
MRVIVVSLLLSMWLRNVPGYGQTVVARDLDSQVQRPSSRGTIEDRVRVLAKTLHLDEAQQFAIKKILEQRQLEMWRIRRGSSTSGAVRIDRFRALQQSTVEQIRAVLNEEQKKNYDPFATRRLPLPQQDRSVEEWLTSSQK